MDLTTLCELISPEQNQRDPEEIRPRRPSAQRKSPAFSNSLMKRVPSALTDDLKMHFGLKTEY